MKNVVEIEVNDQRNSSLHFLPVSRVVRGRFEAVRASRFCKGAVGLLTQWPEPIPGQIIGLNLETGEGYIREPLYDEQHTAVFHRLESRLKKVNQRIGDKRKLFEGVHAPTWLYWMKRAVESKQAVLVEGRLPEVIEGEPKTSFYFPHEKSESLRMAEAIERQAAATQEQTAVLTKLLAELIKGKR